MTELTTTEENYFDLSNPHHFINLLPNKVREAVLKIPGEYLDLLEPKLITKVYPDGVPDDMDQELRINFWEEYDRCFEKCLPMQIKKICAGICEPPQFYSCYLPNHGKLAFIISQPSITTTRMKYGLQLTLKEMIRIAKMKEEINVKTGTTDTKLLELKFKIFEYLDQRLHGSIIQKTETKALNVNVEASPEQVGLPSTPDAIDKRLRELEAELQSQQSLPPAQPMVEIMSPLARTVQEVGRVSEEYDRNKRKE